ncbi:MAG: hypothetical protein IPK83_23325 [Planctomycetes bacterium]|nr:hypothetical protein [Planctomycetota bacterium]
MLPFKNAPNDSMRLFADYPVLLRGGTIRRGVLDEFDTFATNETQWLIAEYAGLEYAKQYCYSDSESEAIMVCDRIEMEAKARNQDHNRSLELIRAGAKLRMGDFDGAKADATTFRDNAKEPLLFGYDNQELFEAIEKSNSEFKLEYWYYLPSTVNWPVDGD